MTRTRAEDVPAEHRSTVAHFTALAEAHGVDARALDWRGRESQELRFSVLARIGIAPEARVLDVGCGQGDLLPWLRARGFAGTYLGVDITPSMVATARQRFPDARFERVDLLAEDTPAPGRFDVVLASGIFYRRAVAPDTFMRAMVARMFALAEHGLAFNSLSTWAAGRDPGEFYADPAAVLAWCRAITPWVALLHDYHPGDFTVLMRRGRAPA